MKRSTSIAIVVFGLLLIAVIFANQSKPERGISRVTFADVNHESIDEVVITGKNAVTLKKDGDVWKVESGKKADANAVKRMVESIPTMVSSDLVTNDAERFEELEVNEEKGTHVDAKAGGQSVAKFTVGKAGKGGAHVKVGSDVYLVSKISAYNFSRDSSAWLERKIFQEKLADVTKVEVNVRGAAPYAITQKDNEWSLVDASVLPAGFRFDKNAARTLASTAVNLRAKDIFDADPGVEKTKLDKEYDSLRITAKGEGDIDVVHELRLGAVEEKAIYAQVVGGDVFSLHESTAKNLQKAATDLRELTMTTVDKDKVKELAIVDGKTRLTLEKKGADWTVKSSSEKIPGDFELDPAAVTRRLTQFASARGMKVAEGVSAGSAGIGSASVTAVLEDGSRVALKFGKEFKDEDSRDVAYAMGNADSAVYVVTKWTRTNLVSGLDKFKKQEEPPGLANIDPSALQNLPPDVRQSLTQQIEQKKKEQEMLKKIQAQMDKKAN